MAARPRYNHDMLRRSPTLLLLLLLLLAGCGRGTEVKLTDADNGTAVTLGPDDTLTVTLQSNATTGYSWEIFEIDDTVLVPDGLPDYQPDAGSAGLLGAGGTQVFRFSPGATGRTSVLLGYRGPSDPVDVIPSQTFGFVVTVGAE